MRYWGQNGTFSEKQLIPIGVPNIRAGGVESILKYFSKLINNEISDALIPLEEFQAGTNESSIVASKKHPVSSKGDLYMPIKSI